MDSREADLALDKLTEDDVDALVETSTRRWVTRMEIGLAVSIIFAVGFLLAYGLVSFVHAYWPGSWIASTVAVTLWLAAFWGMLKFVLFGRISPWLAIRGVRREISRRGAGNGAP